MRKGVLDCIVRSAESCVARKIQRQLSHHPEPDHFVWPDPSGANVGGVLCFFFCQKTSKRISSPVVSILICSSCWFNVSEVSVRLHYCTATKRYRSRLSSAKTRRFAFADFQPQHPKPAHSPTFSPTSSSTPSISRRAVASECRRGQQTHNGYRIQISTSGQ